MNYNRRICTTGYALVSYYMYKRTAEKVVRFLSVFTSWRDDEKDIDRCHYWIYLESRFQCHHKRYECGTRACLVFSVWLLTHFWTLDMITGTYCTVFHAWSCRMTERYSIFRSRVFIYPVNYCSHCSPNVYYDLFCQFKSRMTEETNSMFLQIVSNYQFYLFRVLQCVWFEQTTRVTRFELNNEQMDKPPPEKWASKLK